MFVKLESIFIYIYILDLATKYQESVTQILVANSCVQDAFGILARMQQIHPHGWRHPFDSMAVFEMMTSPPRWLALRFTKILIPVRYAWLR